MKETLGLNGSLSIKLSRGSEVIEERKIESDSEVITKWIQKILDLNTKGQ